MIPNCGIVQARVSNRVEKMVAYTKKQPSFPKRQVVLGAFRRLKADSEYVPHKPSEFNDSG